MRQIGALFRWLGKHATKVSDWAQFFFWLGGTSAMTAAAVYISQIFWHSPLLVQIDYVLVGLAASLVLVGAGLRTGDFIHRKYSLVEMEMKIVCDDSPVARNWRVAVVSKDNNVALEKVFVETTRFEPGSDVPDPTRLREMLVNFRRAPLMWKHMRGKGVSPPVDGKRGLPVLFDFIKHIKEPWATNRLEFCHGYDVDEYEQNNPSHRERSHIRDRKFIRQMIETIPLLAYDVTLAATAKNAKTRIQNFWIRVVNGNEIVEIANEDG